ncbi:hypothetical protein O181_020783 [Austropuccinia psidii MF-1]|uniref:Uncharacterized protein n=1 Tax=Austropuccinia psidii MF-1 TaxID=1389203 RepID=A0A9Q3CC29_9BASI|nr:hypothetical protein [Austropuccinia psidii MF-1]
MVPPSPDGESSKVRVRATPLYKSVIFFFGFCQFSIRTHTFNVHWVCPFDRSSCQISFSRTSSMKFSRPTLSLNQRRCIYYAARHPIRRSMFSSTSAKSLSAHSKLFAQPFINPTHQAPQCLEPPPHAGPSNEFDIALLLKDLKALTLAAQMSPSPQVFSRVKVLWKQWHQFLMTPKGKEVDPATLHDVTHAFLFLNPTKTFRWVGFAALKSQNWSMIRRLITLNKLKPSDMVVLVKS